MLGAGIGLASLTFAIVYEGILRRSLTSKIETAINRSALFGLALMLILPHILHYLASTYMTDEDYVVCNEASHQWLLYKKLAYTADQVACDALVLDQKATKKTRGR